MLQDDSKTILVVDDDTEIRELLRTLLHDKDRIVITASTLQEARHLLESRKFDVVLLDVVLPDGNGIELLKSLKSSRNGSGHPATIVMTAFGTWETHVKANSLGAYYFLDKPFKVTQVKTLVDTYTVNDLDAAAVRVFTSRMKLGEFDDPSLNPWVAKARQAVPQGSWTNDDDGVLRRCVTLHE